MKTRVVTPLVVVALACLAGCASTPPPPVEIAGPAAELKALAGDWSGVYAYSDGHRSGSIRLHLALDPATDSTSAFGDVLMIPLDAGEARQLRANNTPGGSTTSPQALEIRFVSVQGGSISGTMEPYRDPDSGSILSTTFTGRLAGGVIEGAFLAFGGQPNVPLRGTWRVERTHPAEGH